MNRSKRPAVRRIVRSATRGGGFFVGSCIAVCVAMPSPAVGQSVLPSPAKPIQETAPATTPLTQGAPAVASAPGGKEKKFETLSLPAEEFRRTSSQSASLRLAAVRMRERISHTVDGPNWQEVRDAAVNLLEELSAGEIESVSHYLRTTDYLQMSEDLERWFSDTVTPTAENIMSAEDFRELEHDLREVLLGKSLGREQLERMDRMLQDLITGATKNPPR